MKNLSDIQKQRLVKAMDLLDKISNSTGKEPELRSEDVDGVKTNLREKYLVCPGT